MHTTYIHTFIHTLAVLIRFSLSRIFFHMSSKIHSMVQSYFEKATLNSFANWLSTLGGTTQFFQCKRSGQFNTRHAILRANCNGTRGPVRPLPLLLRLLLSPILGHCSIRWPGFLQMLHTYPGGGLVVVSGLLFFALSGHCSIKWPRTLQILHRYPGGGISLVVARLLPLPPLLLFFFVGHWAMRWPGTLQSLQM